MKQAMIWGAGGGIGSAVLRLLAADAWSTVALSRSSLADDQATFAWQADFSDPFAAESAVQAAAMEIDSVDLWIYCAGDIASAKLAQMNTTTWNNIVDANLTGVYTTLHFSLPLLSESAHIFVIGAVSERLRLPGLTAYAASKAGLEAFVEALSKEERKKKISLVRPGAVDTDFWEKVPFRMPAAALPPDAVARAVLRAYDEGHSGQLDL